MKTNIKIEGMTCKHCVAAVSDILGEVDGVEEVNVSLEKAEAVVVGTVLKDDLILALNNTPYKGL